LASWQDLLWQWLLLGQLAWQLQASQTQAAAAAATAAAEPRWAVLAVRSLLLA
jgi:hypothetical protein